MDKLAEYGLVAGIAAIISPICGVAVAAIRGWAGSAKGQPSISQALEQAIITIAQNTETQTELLKQCVQWHAEASKALARIEVKLDRTPLVNGPPRKY